MRSSCSVHSRRIAGPVTVAHLAYFPVRCSDGCATGRSSYCCDTSHREQRTGKLAITWADPLAATLALTSPPRYECPAHAGDADPVGFPSSRHPKTPTTRLSGLLLAQPVPGPHTPGTQRGWLSFQNRPVPPREQPASGRKACSEDSRVDDNRPTGSALAPGLSPSHLACVHLAPTSPPPPAQ